MHAVYAFAEAQCAPFYAAIVGRPSLLPGTYFRLLLIGDFEGIDSERGIAWRTADSLGSGDSWFGSYHFEVEDFFAHDFVRCLTLYNRLHCLTSAAENLLHLHGRNLIGRRVGYLLLRGCRRNPVT